MASTKGSTKAPSNTSQPYNEYDDLNDPNDLPPAYDSALPGPPTMPQQGSHGAQHQSQQQQQQQQQHHQASQGYPGAQYHAQQWPMQAQPHQYSPFQQQLPHPPSHTAPFNYPPGYYCQYCHNTGIKAHNGHACGNCERLFGRQASHVQYVPLNAMPAPGVTYMAGDPRIGGRLCGNCKGRGIRASLFGLAEDQCYVCRGVGRIL